MVQGLEPDEAARLAALRSYRVIGAASSPAFDAIVRVAARVAKAPVAIVSLVDEERVFHLAAIGTEPGKSVSREGSLCAEAIRGLSPFVVEDLSVDARFDTTGLTLGESRLRSYTGLPLVTPDGHALGTLCILDTVVRGLDDDVLGILGDLAIATGRLLEQHRLEVRREEAERGQRTLERERQLLFDALPAAIGYVDPEYICRYFNAKHVEFFGWWSETSIGRPLREVLGEKLFEEHREKFDRALAGEELTWSSKLTDRSGRIRHFEVTCLPIRDEGSVRGAAIVAFEVTAQREAEAMLETEQALQRLVLQNVPDGAVFLFGHDKRVVRAYGGEIFARAGLSARDYEGRLVGEWALPENREPILAAMERCLAGERADVVITRNARTYHTTFVPSLGTDGGVTYGMVFSRDVTEQETMREHVARQERLVTVGTLAAGVGHEINNPLTYVLANLAVASGLLSALQGPATTIRELGELLGETHDGAMRIRDIVRGLAAFSRPDDAATTLDPGKAVTSATRLCGREVKLRAELRLELQATPPVLGDEARVVQVLVNLLVNAAQAFDAGDASMHHVVVRAHADAEGNAVLTVSDDGPGMSKAIADRVFEPFFTTKAVGTGSGLGLWISHNIVVSLGGTIRCESVEGCGTTFTLVFPPAFSSVLPSVFPPARSTLPTNVTTATPKRRVLVVDDELAVGRILGRILRGYEVVILDDPLEARARLARETFDVVFCDMLMPALSGMELHEAVSATQAARFVFMTGDSLRPELRAFFESTPNERLEKPFDANAVRAVAARVLHENV